MKRPTTPDVTYVAGVVCGSLVGFLSPAWFTGFAPLAVGLIYAAHGLADEGVAGADHPTAPRQ